MKRLLLLLFTIATATVTDIDGNVYETLLIGDQLWMKENLKVTHYNDGSEIPTGLDNDAWSSTTDGAYAIYDDDLSLQGTYGNLYNGYTVEDDRGICPEGFHVPTDDEFKELEMSLGMSESEANSTGWRGTNEGSKLAGNYDLWTSVFGLSYLVNDLEFDTSGFNALPAGRRNPNIYRYIGEYFYIWTSSTGLSFPFDNKAIHRLIIYQRNDIERSEYGNLMIDGNSVRCLRD